METKYLTFPPVAAPIPTPSIRTPSTWSAPANLIVFVARDFFVQAFDESLRVRLYTVNFALAFSVPYMSIEKEQAPAASNVISA